MSFAMFLNKLLKYLASEAPLPQALRHVLQRPQTIESGRTRLEAFHDWLEMLIAEGVTTRKAIQPARAPAFVSAFWHMQAVDEWPVYYESARSAFERDGLIDPPTDVIAAYFQFRDVFVELRDALNIDTWLLEQLCHRPTFAEAPTFPPREPVAASATETKSAVEEISGHAHVQWLLATTGRELGCDVWIAVNDRGRQWNGTTLGSLSIAKLPKLGLDDDVTRRLGYIDVLWLKGSRVHAAFEVEHTTSSYSGFLRLSDLVAAAPNLNFRLYIVAPEVRMRDVESELRRPTFQMLELHKRCGFFSEEKLARELDGIVRWASDPRAIDKLATYVEDNVAT